MNTDGHWFKWELFVVSDVGSRLAPLRYAASAQPTQERFPPIPRRRATFLRSVYIVLRVALHGTDCVKSSNSYRSWDDRLRLTA
jgi:hypothetical protein